MSGNSESWLDYFQTHGYPTASRISSGMEGIVFLLVPGELVGKVWFEQHVDTLRRLQAFYDRLASEDGPLRTPRIVDIDVVDGVAITTETFLPGTTVERSFDGAEPRAIEAIIEGLDFLRGVGDDDAFRQMPVLGETEPLWRGARGWSDALGGLLQRRIARYGAQLESAVPDFQDIVDATLRFVGTRNDAPSSVIHGDLCPANMLVDDDREPTALLDFGFLSTVGDPAFDASIASAIFEMYGPKARRTDEQLCDALVRSLGFRRDVLLAYRAVYALLTSNAYAEDGSDGHFRWCADMLRRDDVQAALGDV